MNGSSCNPNIVLSPNHFTPGSAAEKREFQRLQVRLKPMFQRVFSDRKAPRTVVIIPSLTLDPEEMAKIPGLYHYEERLLCLLLLLQLPCTRIVLVTSRPVPDAIIDYYLHMIPGVPGLHARRRLTLFSCHDNSPISLTEKILRRPRLIQRIREAIANPELAHITCFNSTPLERTLAVKLGIPLYANDPDLAHLGNKSYSRQVFKEAGVLLPDGFEHLKNEDDIIEALTQLKLRHPELRKAVIKLNESFSGEGNATFSYEEAPEDPYALKSWIAEELPRRIHFEAEEENWPHYLGKFREMGGIVECWIDGSVKRSPSVQCRINPLRQIELISTHDQILGGPTGQIYLGCWFPADEEYRLDLQTAGLKIADVLNRYGVLGRFSVDFVSIKEGDTWKHYAVEINLRKGGTTFPYLLLHFLVNGRFDPETGLYFTPAGQPRYYFASDDLMSENYLGLLPHDLIDIMVYNGLHFHGPTQQGVIFHMMGPLSEYGKFGLVSIGDSYDTAKVQYQDTISLLNRITAFQHTPERTEKIIS